MDENPFNAASQGAEEIDLYGAYSFRLPEALEAA